jgi:hypothetical protein
LILVWALLRLVNFAQTPLRARPQIWRGDAKGEIVAIPKNGKHKEYVRYAAHCLEMVPSVPDQEYRVIQRQMAAEWLKLADAVIHPLGPMKSK